MDVLPFVPDFLRAMPNHIARSSLFAPVAPGKKKIHKDAVIISRNDATITFSGEQLDESQADIWMQAMHIASKHPLGEPVTINRAAFLRSIGRHTGSAQYKWLHRAFKALCFALLIIEASADGKKYSIGKTTALHMLNGFEYDLQLDMYTLRVDPRWRILYDTKEYALLDWGKRLRFGEHQNMSKALQRLVATSSNMTQYYDLEWLKNKMCYGGRMRDFKDTLARALVELERLNIIGTGKITRSTRGKTQLFLQKM
jgi:hypothetical protein